MAFAVFFPFFSVFAAIQPQVIYGKDGRLDVYQVSDRGLRSLAESTAAQVDIRTISRKDGWLRIKQRNYGPSFGLCKDEPFYYQPAVAGCTGFLIGRNLLATTGHCVMESTCRDQAYVFGYRMTAPTRVRLAFADNEVYRCRKVLVHKQDPQGADYAIVQLDRPVRGRRPLRLAAQPPRVGDSLIMIGHPMGLPSKISVGGSVREHKPEFFVANLDSYQSNSGSPVINARTREVVGLLVRGEMDYVFDTSNACTRSKVCADGECRGEDVTHISFLREFLSR